MSDFERLLKSSLQDVGSGFDLKDTQAARERFLRARRRRHIKGFVSGLAVAGVATAAVFFVVSSGIDAPEETSPQIVPAADPLSVTQTIPVGGSPVGVTVDDEGIVWVANVEAPSVSRYDPASDRVDDIPVPASPDDVAATDRYIYATDVAGRTPPKLTGSATVIDRFTRALASTKNLDDIPNGARAQLFGGTQTEGSGTDLGHVDVAASGETLWAVSSKQPGVALNYTTGGTRVFSDVPPTGEVAVLEGTGFALDATERVLYRLEAQDFSKSGKPLTLPPEIRVAGGGNLDMVGGFNSIWIVQDGVLYRIDPETGFLTASLELEGADYAAVATGESFVWVLEGNVDETLGGRLYKVDPDTAEIVGEPLALEGKLADVAAGGGGVWVTSKSSGTLLEIAPFGP